MSSPSDQLGDFILLDCLGRGGMGAVYRARRATTTGEVVAIKTLSAALQSDPQALGRLRRELRAATELSHENIVRTFAIEDTPQGPVLVMEYAEGLNLQEHVDRNGTLPTDQAVELIRQASRGLGHAHERGVVHRDIKPSNLMVGPDGRIRVLDFGIAKVAQSSSVEANTLTELTQSGAVLGTVDFMAPEQAFDSKSVDGRADIYSLGCTLYFLLHGAPPFRGETAVETLLAHSEGRIPALAAHGARRLRRGLEAIYRRMLSKKPADRFATMADLITALDNLDRSMALARTRARHAVTAAFVSIAGCAIVFALALAQGRFFPHPDPANATVDVAITSASTEGTPTAWSTVAWQPHPEKKQPIPGLIAYPPALPPWTAWQLETRQPRTQITSMAWSHDGQRLYYGTLVGQLWVYDVADQRLLGIYPLGPQAIMAIAVHPNNQLIATIESGSWSIQFWNANFERGAKLSGHEQAVTDIAWSPDGNTLASSGRDGAVRLWNEQGKPLANLGGHEGAVHCVAWHPSSTQFASGGADKSIRIWNIDGTAGPVLTGHEDQVRSIAWHPDGTRLLSGGADKQVRIWEVATGESRVVDERTAALLKVGWSPDGETIATLTVMPEMQLVLQAVPPAPDSAGSQPTSEPNPSPTASAKSETRYSAGDTTAFAWHPDGFLFAGGMSFGGVQLTGLDGRLYLEINARVRDGMIGALHWHPDGTAYASTHYDGSVRVWDRMGRLLKSMTGHRSAVVSVRWSRDGTRLATAGTEGTVRVWNRDGTPLHVFEGHTGLINIYSIAWSPDGRWVASASFDGTVRLWSLDGEKTRVLSGHQGGAQSVDWNLDGQTIASIDGAGTIRLWRPDGGLITTMQSSGPGQGVVAWNADGHTLATNIRAQLQLWDATGKLLRETPIVGNLVQWSPAGDRLIAGNTMPLRIWTVDGDRQQSFTKHYRQAFAFAWHPRDDLVLTSGPEGVVCAWNPTTGETEWVGILLDGDEHATFNAAGRLLSGNPRAVQRELVVLTRDTAGKMGMLPVAEFLESQSQPMRVRIYE